MVNGLLTGLMLVGLVLVLSPHFVAMGEWGLFPAHLGIAFLVSGILGLTVEKYTKTRFASEIANDVFKHTLGHLLPNEFQEEMRWIYEQKVICRNHQQQVKITRVGNGDVKFSCRLERHLTNVSNSPQEVPVSLGVDEWFATAPSEILAVGHWIEGGERREAAPPGGGIREMKGGRPVIRAKEGNIKVGPGKTVVVWSSFQEVKPLNSDHHSHFTYATKNPRVTIEADEGIVAIAAFPRETDTNKVQTMVDSYTYNGLVLPAQEIRIRWWEEAKRLAWINRDASASAESA